MADLVNTVGGFLQIGILYATVLRYRWSASAIIGIQVFTNLVLFSARTYLSQNGITKTTMMYEALLALVLAVLYFWIMLSRFNILETIGIWIVATLVMVVLIAVSMLFRPRGEQKKSQTATLEVPVEPRYVMRGA